MAANVRETRLCPDPRGHWGINRPIIRGGHIAWVEKRGRKQVVVRDGNPEKDHDIVDEASVVFSPDCSRLAYVARDGRRASLIIDDEVHAEADDIAPKLLVFSPDSKRLSCIARRRKKWSVVVDDNFGSEYDGILLGEEYDAAFRTRYSGLGFRFPYKSPGLAFSPDSSRLAYAARIGKEWFPVVDGEEGRKHSAIAYLMFSPDSRRLAYAAQGVNGAFFAWSVVLDGEEGKLYWEVERPKFSPDSRRFAYIAHVNAGLLRGVMQLAVVDGKEEQSYARVDEIVFSPDSRQVAYCGKRVVDRKVVNGVVVTDGKKGKEYKDVGYITFSPDSSRMAYEAQHLDTSLFGGWGPDRTIVLDGKEGEKHNGLFSTIEFSPDSQRVAYLLRGGGGISVVVDGKRKAEELGPLPQTPVFSPNSKRVAYVVARKTCIWASTKLTVVIDGREGKGHNHVMYPEFSADSQSVVYVAQNRKRWVVVVDEDEGMEYDWLSPEVLGEHCVEYLGIREGWLCRCVREMKPTTQA